MEIRFALGLLRANAERTFRLVTSADYAETNQLFLYPESQHRLQKAGETCDGAWWTCMHHEADGSENGISS